MNQADILIIGQGLAGSLLYWALRQRGRQALIVDAGLSQAASMVAAGAMAPCTSPRYTSPQPLGRWLDDAVRTWRHLERQLDIPLFRPQELIRLFREPAEAERVHHRRTEPDVASVLSPPAYGSPAGLASAPGHVRIRSAQIDLPRFLEETRTHLRQHGLLIEQSFDPETLVVRGGTPCWDDRPLSAVVLCQGWRGRDHGPLRQLAWRMSRGEALVLRGEPGWPALAVTRGYSLVPMTDGRYWLGATYDRGYDDMRPQAAARTALLASLPRLLAAAGHPEILEHRVGVRIGSRRDLPFCARLPGAAPVYLFNGLGSRGTLLGPRCAQAMAAHLCEGAPLPVAWNPWDSDACALPH